MDIERFYQKRIWNFLPKSTTHFCGEKLAKIATCDILTIEKSSLCTLHKTTTEKFSINVFAK